MSVRLALISTFALAFRLTQSDDSMHHGNDTSLKTTNRIRLRRASQNIFGNAAMITNTNKTSMRYLSTRSKQQGFFVGASSPDLGGVQAAKCSSVILLSPGRTATDTVSHTITQSSTLRYCDGTKEYYGHGKLPDAASLQRCFEKYRDRGGVYIHVKPEHITLDEKQSRGNRRVIKSPEEFFSAAKSIGFRIVAVGWRDNQLAREISSFEMFAGKPGTPQQKFDAEARKHFTNRNMVKFFGFKTMLFNRGVIAARKNGLKIVPMSFNDIVKDVCGTSRRVAEAASCPKFRCHIENGHTDKSHHDRGLEGRVGKAAADHLVQELTGTAYEWMLDLEASEWPLGVPRPVPLIES